MRASCLRLHLLLLKRWRWLSNAQGNIRRRSNLKNRSSISAADILQHLTVREQFLRTFALWRQSPLPDLRIFQPDSLNFKNIRAYLKQPIAIAIGFSLAFHAFALFGIGFVFPDLAKNKNFLQPLEVVLVNSKSGSRPVKADALAQHNLDGGGNTEENMRASSPLPNLSDDKQFTPEQSKQHLQKLEQ